MRLSAAIRTRSDGDWHSSGHYSNLEIRGEIMNSITHVSKDTLVLEIYEQQAKDDDDGVQPGMRGMQLLPERKTQ